MSVPSQDSAKVRSISRRHNEWKTQVPSLSASAWNGMDVLWIIHSMPWALLRLSGSATIMGHGPDLSRFSSFPDTTTVIEYPSAVSQHHNDRPFLN